MKKKLIIILPIIIALLAFVFVYRYYNKEDKTTSLTVTEKKWLEENSKTAVDFEVINDYPLYGMNGSGVFFDFIKDFEESIKLDFNKIPYLKDSTPTTTSYRIRILDNDANIGANDLLLFQDSYIAIGKEYQRINHIKDMKNITFGVFKEDSAEISYYLKSGTNLAYKAYEKIDDLYQALEKGEVNMIITPNIMYLDRTIDKKYSINYYFTEMRKRVVLTLSDKDEKLNKIVRKYFTKWKATKYIEEYNDAYLDYYLDKNKLDAKTKASLISKNYTYGYVENSPYEAKVNKKVSGIAGEYIDRIARLTDIEFVYKKYNSKKELEKAVQKGEVDVYFDYYNLTNKKYLATLSTFVEDYVILGKSKDNHIINSFESLKGEKIVMLKGDSLYNYFENNSRADITTYESINDIAKKANDKMIVIERSTIIIVKRSSQNIPFYIQIL